MAKCKLNQRRKRGRCVKRTGVFKFFNRKTKNPFKMIGSYLGVIAILIANSLLIPSTILGWIGFDQILVIPFADSIAFVFKTGTNLFMLFICLVIAGFLIGYAIQLILRLFRK